MQKGQVSLEIIIVILGIVTALGTIGIMVENSVQSQETVLLQNQAKGIASEVANGLNGLALLSGTANESIVTIPTRQPIISDPSHFDGCTIQYTIGPPGKITVRIARPAPETAVVSEKPVVTSGWSIPASVSCGSAITATKTP